jgi:hypothetical protein
MIRHRIAEKSRVPITKSPRAQDKAGIGNEDQKPKRQQKVPRRKQAVKAVLRFGGIHFHGMSLTPAPLADNANVGANSRAVRLRRGHGATGERAF